MKSPEKRREINKVDIIYDGGVYVLIVDKKLWSLIGLSLSCLATAIDKNYFVDWTLCGDSIKKDVVIVRDEVYELATDFELKSILAHEFMHLSLSHHTRDNVSIYEKEVICSILTTDKMATAIGRFRKKWKYKYGKKEKAQI